MKTTEIRDLIEFISKSGLNEVNIETKELKLQREARAGSESI
jgi:acetyl-CoA carboxylase biotin carboxyl carrier protein